MNLRIPRFLCARLARAALLLACLLSLSRPTPLLGAPADRSVHFPPGWTSAVVNDCQAADLWQITGVSGAPGAGLSVNRLSLSRENHVRGNASCCWELRPRGEANAWAELASKRLPAGRLDAVSVWVKNPQGRRVVLQVKLRDADGADYVALPVALGDERNWREVAFCLPDYVLAAWSKDPHPGLDFPLKGLSLMVGGLQPGVLHTLYFDDLCVHVAPSTPPAPLPRFDVIALGAPGEVEVGKPVALRVRLRVLTAASRALELHVGLALNGGVAAEAVLPVPVPAGTAPGALLAPVEATLSLPAAAAAGVYEVKAWAPGADIVMPDPRHLATSRLTVTAPERLHTASAVETKDRVTAITVCGARLATLTTLADVSDDRELAAIAAARPQVVRFRVNLGVPEPGGACAAWLGPDRYNFDDVDAALHRLLAAVPGVLVLPELCVNAPTWWRQAHPRELLRLSGGASKTAQKWDLPPPSVSSAAWGADAAQAVGALVTHLERGPFGDVVAAYQVSSGLQGRWISEDVTADGVGDYSAPQEAAFQRWLESLYGTLEALHGAWSQPVHPVGTEANGGRAVLSWQEARIPSAEQRTRGRTWLLDPAEDQAVVDYRRSASHATVALADALAGAVKAACGGAKVCGAAYGHFMELAAHDRALELGGHLAVSEALEAKNLDFLVGPPTTVAPHAALMPTASVFWARKAYLPDGSAPGGDPWEAVAASLEQGPTVCAPPVKGLGACLDWLASLDTRSNAEIAVLVDDASAAYLGHRDPVKKPLLTLQMAEVRKVGAPVDVWLLRDLLERRLPPYKLYVFVDAFRVGPERIPALLAALGPGRRTAVWMCAPGVVGGGLSGRLMFHLTGVGATVEDRAGPLLVNLTAPVSSLTPGLAPGLSYGLSQTVSPQLDVVGDRLRVLGTNPRGQPTLVAAEAEGKVSVFSAAPDMPAELLRALARGAGVHIYTQGGDRFYCTRSLVALHAEAPGRRVIQLPRPADVYQLPANTKMATGAREIVVEMRQGETRLFRLQGGDATQP